MKRILSFSVLSAAGLLLTVPGHALQREGFVLVVGGGAGVGS